MDIHLLDEAGGNLIHLIGQDLAGAGKGKVATDAAAARRGGQRILTHEAAEQQEREDLFIHFGLLGTQLGEPLVDIGPEREDRSRQRNIERDGRFQQIAFQFKRNKKWQLLLEFILFELGEGRRSHWIPDRWRGVSCGIGGRKVDGGRRGVAGPGDDTARDRY